MSSTPTVVLGDLLGPVGRLDGKGRILTGAFTIDWAVSADDGWRLAHAQRLRRGRVNDTPVHERTMRVPSGEMIQRVAVVNDGVRRAVAIEFDNASAAAVLVAVACRRAALLEAAGDGIRADGEKWVTSSRAAGGVAATRAAGGVVAGVAAGGVAAGADRGARHLAGDAIWDLVRAGPGPDPTEASGPSAAAALVLAVPHSRKVSVAIGVDGPPPERLPEISAVAAGWKAVTRRALSLDLPDTELTQAWRRAIGDLVVLAGSPDVGEAAAAAAPLDLAGLVDEADRARATVVAAVDHGSVGAADAPAALRALASRELVAGRPSGLDQLAGPLAHAARGGPDAQTLAMTAAALDGAFPAAAADARRLAEQVKRLSPEPSPVAAAAAAAAILSRLVTDPYDPTGAALMAEFPPAWYGQALDVDGLHTAAGVVSFAVRRHGERPALLWERRGGPDDAVLTAPGLDPQWATTSRSGETLLTPRGNYNRR